MPNINDKGTSVYQWIANILVGLLCTATLSMYNQQSAINEKVLETLGEIKNDINLGGRDYSYLREKVQRLENANEKLEQENEQQQRDIDDLKRHHR